MEELKVVVFRVGPEEYAINIEDVISIERMQPVTALPKSPEYISGVINIRDVVTPVLDLRIALGQKQFTTDDLTRILLIRVGEKPVGLIVDAATDVIDIPTETIQQPDLVGIEMDSFLKGVSKLSDRLLIILDIQSLLKEVDAFDKLKDFKVA